MKLKTIGYLALISLLFLSNVLKNYNSGLRAEIFGYQDIKKLSIEEAKELVDIFLNNPDEQNFNIIKSHIFPILEDNKRKDSAWMEWVSQLLHYCLDRDEAYWIMEHEIFTGNLYMSLFAKKLIYVSDGRLASVLFTLFGRLTRINPKLFLTVFKEDAGSVEVELAVRKPIFFTGTELYEKYERLELMKRIEALRSITDPELKKIKDYCISVLEWELR